jgi:hypothetical protein
MKKILLSIFAVICIASIAVSQTTISIGTKTGQGSTNVLLSTSTTINRYSRTISLYNPNEIIGAGGVAGTITSLSWDKNGTGEYTTNNAYIRVLLKNVPQATWPSPPDWTTETTGAAEVFTSTTYSIPTGTGWKALPFTTPFVWDGTSSIAVMVEWDRSSAPTADIQWGRSTDANTNAARVGSTSLNALVFFVNGNRPIVQFVITPTASVDDVANSISMFPNPTSGIVRLSSIENMVSATITDLSGKTVHETGLSGVDGQVDLSNLAQGMYLLRVNSTQGISTMRVIKD